MNKKQWISLFEKNNLEVVDLFPNVDSLIHFNIYNIPKHGYLRFAVLIWQHHKTYYVALGWRKELLSEYHQEVDWLDDEEYIFRVISGFLDGNLEICKEDIAEEKEILEKKEEIERWEQMSLF